MGKSCKLKFVKFLCSTSLPPTFPYCTVPPYWTQRHYLPLSCHRPHKASATVLQHRWYCAFFLTTAQDNPRSSNSCCDVLRHVALGCPLSRLPSGIKKSPVLLMDVSSFLRMFPMNRHFLSVIFTMMFF